MLIILVFLLFCVNIHSTIINVMVDFTDRSYNIRCSGEYNLTGGENILNIIDFCEKHMDPGIKSKYNMKNFRVSRISGLKSSRFTDINYECNGDIINFKEDMSEFDNVDIFIYTEPFLSRFLSIKFSRDIFCCPFDIGEDIDFDDSELQIKMDDLVESLGKGKIRDYIAGLIFECAQTHLKEGGKRKYSGVTMSLRTFLEKEGKKFILPKCSTIVKFDVITPGGFKLKPDVDKNFEDFETAFKIEFNRGPNVLLDENIYELKSTIKNKIPILDPSEKDDIIEFCDKFEFQKEIKAKLYLCERSKYLDTINIDLKFEAPKGYEVVEKLKVLDGRYVVPIARDTDTDLVVYTKLAQTVAKKHLILKNKKGPNSIFFDLLGFISKIKIDKNSQTFKDKGNGEPVSINWNVSEINPSFMDKVTVDGNKDYQIQNSDRKPTTNNIGLPDNSCCLSCCKCCKCSGSCC